MEFPLRFAVVLLAALFATSVMGAAISAVVWRRWLAAKADDSVRPPARPAVLATRLTMIRTLPLLLGVAATTLLAAPAFQLYEPRHVEDMPIALIGLASAGAALLAGTLARVLRILWHTQRVRREWTRTSQPLALPDFPVPAFVIENPFPVVALLGLRKPMLFVARQVVEECSPVQLAAIVDHERAHLLRRDNLTRLLMDAMWDPLAWIADARAVRIAWLEASEQAADDGARDQIALAEGLVRVAKLAPRSQPVLALASALLEGQEIERRVRRLIEARGGVTQPRSRRPVRRTAIAAAVALACTAAFSADLLRRTHDVIELAVTGLR